MSKYQRDKGAAWERQVARDLTKATGMKHHRCLTETQQGNVGDIATPLPFVFQCKVGARPPIYQAMREAEAAAGATHYPVAVIKRDNREKLMVFTYADGLELISMLVREGVL